MCVIYIYIVDYKLNYNSTEQFTINYVNTELRTVRTLLL